MLALCHYCLFGWHCAHFNFIFVCLSCHMSICVSVSNILLTLRPLYCSPLKPSSSWVKGRFLTLPFLKHFFLSLLEVKLKVRVGVKLQWHKKHKKVQILVRSPIVWVSGLYDQLVSGWRKNWELSKLYNIIVHFLLSFKPCFNWKRLCISVL